MRHFAAASPVSQPPRPSALAAAALAVLLAACSSTDDDSPMESSVASPTPLVQTPPDLFAAGASLLSGFDAPEPDAPWRLGDRALFGLKLVGADAELVRYVSLEARSAIVASGTIAFCEDFDPVRGSMRPHAVIPRHQTFTFTESNGAQTKSDGSYVVLAAEVFDETARSLGRRLVTVPATSLAEGFAGAARRLKADLGGATDPAQAPTLSPEAAERSRRDQMALITTLFGFLETFQQHSELERLRERAADALIRRPSLLGMLFGVSLSLDPRVAAFVDDPTAYPARAVAETPTSVPIRFKLNDSHAMTMTFAAIVPAPPFHVAAGLLAFSGRHPTDPARRLEAVLLAARRGPAP